MAAAIREGQYASLSNGMRLHYASAGEPGRPLLLFVHGFPEFWYEWQAQLAAFGGDYYAVALDLRGFNLSDKPADVAAYRPRHVVDDLLLFATQLGYGRFTMVAHDWGGAFAWTFAMAQPGMLDKLIVINAPHTWLYAEALAHDPLQQQASSYMNWLRAPGSEDALAKDDFQLLDGFFRDSTGWLSGATRARYHECWARGLHGGVNLYRASPLHPPTPGEPGPAALQLNKEDFRVRVPTRIIWGEKDIALRSSLLDGIEDVVDDVCIERIPEGTHWVVHEQPERINALIRQFLQD